MNNVHEHDLHDAVEASANEYRALAEQHEQLLMHAHRAPRASRDMVRALRYANELGPHVMMALRRYLDAIEILTVFYHSTGDSASEEHVTIAAFAPRDAALTSRRASAANSRRLTSRTRTALRAS
jgi:hypothetical protein